ncbi:MAG: NBR1-Ig-like domain-containing protein [Myxococcota bacterium]
MTKIQSRMWDKWVLTILATTAIGCGEEGLFGTTAREVAPAGSAVTFVSNTIPTTMAPGERVNVQVVAQNSGTVDWSVTTEWGLRDANLNFGWANDFIDSPTAQGASSTHNFVITAPAASTTLEANIFSYVSGQSGIVSGGPLSVPITISGATTPQYDCTYVSDTIPDPIPARTITSASVTVRNTGAQTWSAGDFCLYARENADSTSPDLTRWGSAICTSLGSAVAPNDTATFTFNITAPEVAGTYRFMREMRDLRSADAGGIANFFRSSTFCVDESIVVSAATPPLDASIVSDTVPTTVAPGDVIPVSVTVQNTGTDTWLADGTFLFSSQTSPPNFWGVTSAPLTADVAPGASTTLNMTVRVPSSPTGLNDFTFSMFKTGGTGAFGTSLSKSIDISAAATPALDASFTANTLPASIAPNSSQTVTVTVQNTGTETWLNDGTYRLVATTSPQNLWGTTSTPVSASVAQNGSTVFTFVITSPNVLGMEDFRYQMSKSGSGAFGPELVVASDVSGMVTPPYDSSFVSQTIPSTADANQSLSFTITFRNDGTQTWPGSSDIYLYSDNTPFTLWGTNIVQLGSAVAPGANATFTFNVTAPASPGTYTSQWRMHQLGGVGYFGASSTPFSVTVSPPAGCGDGTVDSGSGETCDDGNTTAGDGCSASCIIESVTQDLASGPSARTFTGVQTNGQTSSMIIAELNGVAGAEFIAHDFSGIPARNGRPIRNQAGRVYIYSGGAGFFTNGSGSINGTQTSTVFGVGPGDHLGGINGGAAVGDVTNDGNADLVLGAEFADATGNTRSNAGEVYVVRGDASLYSNGNIDLATSTLRGATLEGAAAGDRLSVLAVGDVTNDGVPDIIAGARFNDAAGTDAGAVYVVAGGAGLTTTSTIDLSSATIQARITGEVANGWLGQAAAVGDFTGDGINDLAVSAPNATIGGRTRSGAVYVLQGPVSGTLALSNPANYLARYQGETVHVLYGTDLDAADVQGTANVDLIVGAGQADDGGQSGEVHVWQGPISSGTVDNAVTAANASIFGEAFDFVGGALGVGDTNGDGSPDIVFGAGLADGTGNGRASSGEVGLVLGGSSLAFRTDFTNVIPYRILGEASADLLGYLRNSVAVGDIDGDGRADWCVGARLGGDSAFPGAGRIDCIQSPW